MIQKWLGPNHGPHWTIAGALAVTMLGGYLIYNNRESNNSIIPPSATAQTPAPIVLTPPTSKK